MTSTAPVTTSVGAVRVRTGDGEERVVDVRYGTRLMMTLKSAGVGVIGMCGGLAACGTCHVYVSDPRGADLPERSEDELDMLDELSSRRDCSRLSCQITLTPELDGLELEIAPHD